jgi:hypothetical protein
MLAVDDSMPSGRLVVNSSNLNKATAIAVGEGSQAVAGGVSSSGGKNIGSGMEDTGILSTETRSFDNCNALEIENFPGEVFVRFGKTNSAIVSADSSVISAVKTAMRGEILVVSLTRDIITNMPMSIDLDVEKISSLVVNGAANVVVKNIKLEKFRVEVNGSASITANGTVSELDASIKGNGELKFGHLLTNRSTVILNGTGEVEANVIDSLIAKINGAGSVVYHGNPSNVSKSVNGAGNISPARK